ncbi:NAD(P)/FAD-dependent oxidoreductase [Ramlibacter sp. PS4R-6]|uniref:NAD(P)/FAD-dependent oxidoreductase n=1 Tax=Ramlibacter sp. PS4R-6 TaxID=3133438 RepID=UPI0030B4B36B
MVEADAVVIGAGPVGLFQVFELGLLEIKAHVIDTLPYPGGQCIELYPDKPIYDIPAVPVCTGKELTDNLLKQIEPFGPTFHLGHTVMTLEKRDDGRFAITTDKGGDFLAKTVFIAAGMGAFEPRALALEGIAKYRDTQLFYSVKKPALLAGKHLVILGGGDSALDWALNFAQDGPNKAASITLVHRRDGFKAAPASIAKMKELVEAKQMRFVVGQASAYAEQDGQLSSVTITAPDNSTQDVRADAVLVFFGLSPRLGPIANWGIDIERRQLKVDTEKFSTSVPGIFAVGDINTYPGKKKLILSGFHECALAAFGAAPIVFPGKPAHLQYTTTSTKLHKVLGVETPTFD